MTAVQLLLKAAKKGQETSIKLKNCNLGREYRDCIKSRRNKIGHIIML